MTISNRNVDCILRLFLQASVSIYNVMGQTNGKKSIQLTKQQINVLEKKTKLSRKEIRHWYESFIAENPTGRFDKETYVARFKQLMPGVSVENYCNFTFHGMDKNNDGTIDFQEFLISMTTCFRGNLEDQLSDIFDVCDLSGDGFIDLQELTDYLSAKLEFFREPDEQDGLSSRERATQFMAKFAKDGAERITKAEFIAGCKGDPLTFAKVFPSAGTAVDFTDIKTN